MPMAILLPVWITFGRGAFGSGGWVTLVYIFTVGPILLVALLIIRALISRRAVVKISGLVSPLDACLPLGL